MYETYTMAYTYVGNALQQHVAIVTEVYFASSETQPRAFGVIKSKKNLTCHNQ